MIIVTEGIGIITHSTESKYKIAACDKHTISKQERRSDYTIKNTGTTRKDTYQTSSSYFTKRKKKMPDGLVICQNEIIKIKENVDGLRA